MKLRSIVPPQGDINLDLALEWLKLRQHMDITEKAALGKQNQINVLEDLEFRIQKAKCAQMLANAVQIWKVILDQKPQKKLQQYDYSAFDDEEMKNEEDEDLAMLTNLTSGVISNPTQKDYELAC